MEALKSAVGIGKKDQEGQEPVSGHKGEGTAAEPFDQGNADDQELAGKAPQETNTTAEPSNAESKPSDTATATATASGKSDSPAPASASKDSKDMASKQSIGGSDWFKTSFAFGKDKNGEGEKSEGETGETSEQQAAPGASMNEERDRPPNHLGESVPAGHSTDLDTKPRIEQEPPKMDSSTNRNVSPVPAINEPDRFDPSKAEQNLESSTNSTPTASRKVYGENPAAIPFAGRERIGSVHIQAREQRRKSSQLSRSDLPPPSTDSTTLANTARNAGPTQDQSADVPNPVAPDDVKVSPGSSAGHERLGGVLDKVKGKLHLGKKDK